MVQAFLYFDVLKILIISFTSVALSPTDLSLSGCYGGTRPPSHSPMPAFEQGCTSDSSNLKCMDCRR